MKKNVLSFFVFGFFALFLTSCTLFGTTSLSTEVTTLSTTQETTTQEITSQEITTTVQTTTQMTTTAQTTTQMTTTIQTTTTVTTSETIISETLQRIYDLMVDADSFNGTYLEWLETIDNPDCSLESETEFQVAQGSIRWKYFGDESWTDLIDISLLAGDSSATISQALLNESNDLIITFSNDVIVNLGDISIIFTVEFIDFDGRVISTQDIAYGLDASLPSTPLREGYNFTSWDCELTEVTSDLTIIAIYTPIEYVINFESNDGTEVSEISMGYELELPVFETPTKIGYEFLGWYEDQDLETLFVGTTVPLNGLTLYAKWNLLQFNMDYVIVGESVNNIGIFAISEDELITFVSLGCYHSLAITSENRLFTWGFNYYGQLGDGTTANKYTPIEITSNFDLNSGEALKGTFLGDYNSLAITSEGRIFTWGLNGFGQLGDGTTANKYTPSEITSSFNLNAGEILTSISLGTYHSSAITSEGRIFTWGLNGDGQLGDGTNVNRNTPTEITSNFNLNTGETITSISLGGSHSLAITSEGRLFIWGNNHFGQLGDGTTANKYTPTEITSNFSLNTGETLSSISLGNSHSSAITSENRLFTWGNNYCGQLGDGTNVNKYTPTEITSNFGLNPEESFTNISMNGSHSSAITSEGRIFTWGYNYYGQLGDGTTANKYTPTEITSNFDLNPEESFTNISLGGSHSSAITSEGRLFTWGYNNYGQLGDTTTTRRYNPTEVTFINSIEVVHSEEYEYNEEISDYYITDENYIFDGWYQDINLTIPYVNTTMPAENITIYAALLGLPKGITYEIVDDEVIITGYSGSKVNLVFPDCVDGFPITTIQENAFLNNYTIQSIALGKYMTTIEANAFKSAMYLKSITIPSSITSIGAYAFAYAQSLTSIQFEDGSQLTRFETGIFSYCTSLKTITIPENVTTINSNAFLNATSLKNVSLPTSLTTIQASAFYNTYSLRNINLPLGLSYIGAYAFCNASKLAYIIIPTSTSVIGYGAFAGCNSLTIYTKLLIRPGGWDVNWNFTNRPVVGGILNYGTYQEFVYIVKSNNTIIILGQDITSTKTELVIPLMIVNTQVNEIAQRAFEENDIASSISIPISVTTIGYYAFNNSIAEIYAMISEEPTNWTSNSWNPDGNTVYWGNTIFYLSTVTYETFEGTSINPITQVEGTLITAPDEPLKEGYTFNGWYIDAECTTVYNFTSMPIDDITLYAKWIRNQSTITFEVDGGSVLDPITQDEDTAITAPNQPTKLYYTFVGWYIESEFITEYEFVMMPIDDVTLYAKWVPSQSTIYFETNEGSLITSITQDESSSVIEPESPTKQYFTFSGWYLESNFATEYEFLTMPVDDVTLYAKWIANESTISFESNGGTDVSIIIQNEGTVVDEPVSPTWEGFTFGGWFIDSDLTTEYEFSTMPIDDLTLYAKWNGSVIIEVDGMVFVATSLEATLIEFNGALTNLIIPEMLRNIIPVVAIGDGVFEWTDIVSVSIPATVKVIEKDAFSATLSLRTVTFGENSQLQMIGDSAFYFAYKLSNFELPITVTSIGDSAFLECSALKSIVLSNAVTNIGEYAFGDCDGLTINIVSSTVPVEWNADWNPDNVPVFLGYIETIDNGELLYATSIHNEATIIGLSPSNEDSDIVIPSSLGEYTVVSINIRAFQDNTQLISITIPNTIHEIQKQTFDSASNLTTVLFEAGSQLTTISRYAFSYCESLESIVLPDTVTSIGIEAFFYTRALTSIIIPLSVTDMGDGVFSFSDLTVIYVEAASLPIGWDSNWNPDDLLVIWDYSE